MKWMKTVTLMEAGTYMVERSPSPGVAVPYGAVGCGQTQLG